jgi:polysaccharide deacetylase 2 family uncharacterized protein YibQ
LFHGREKEVREKLDVLLTSIPGIAGVNNHQGSKATKDARLMRLILSEIEKKGLFFLDSRTTSKSVCPKVATGLGVRFAQSDGFIDIPPFKYNEKEYQEYVRKNLKRLSAIAAKKGSAIMIGHDLKATMDVLSTEIPKLEREGFKFVFLSELVQKTRKN